MNITSVTNPEARAFLSTFFMNRDINKKYFQIVPEESFDFRMVDTLERKSDSPRESLAHQINVEKTYLLGVKTGELKFGVHYDPYLKTKSKEELLKILDETDQEMITLLQNNDNVNRVVVVPWNKNGIKAIQMLWSLNSHEILHTGWNLAVMDHLNIERFPALREMWG